MKKTIIIALLSLIIVPALNAQIRYKKSVNIELGGGVNDMKCLSPTVGIGYVFNIWLSGYMRYSLATKEMPGFRFFENNAEILLSLSPLYFGNNLKRKVSFNVNVGTIFKFQNFGDFKPTPVTHPVNWGITADGELEYAIGDYWSMLGRATYRALFLDERFRQEMFYSVGVRMSLDIFNFAERRLIKADRIKR